LAKAAAASAAALPVSATKATGTVVAAGCGGVAAPVAAGATSLHGPTSPTKAPAKKLRRRRNLGKDPGQLTAMEKAVVR
jgi:hypothetical protein